MKTNLFKIILFVVLVLFTGVNQFGKELKVKSILGEDDLMLPRQIVVSGNEIYVLDEYGNMTSGDEKIKVFSPSGKLLNSIGSRGEGPGEFLGVASFDIFEDNIFVIDSRRQLTHIFSVKDKKFIKFKRYSNSEITSTILDFTIAPNGLLYHSTLASVKGDKLITRFNRDFKADKTFLDCIPIFENHRQIYKADRSNPDFWRKGNLNRGYITSTKDKIYFTTWLLNQVVELSLDGEVLKRYTLPIDSIDKTVKLIKHPSYFVIERKLNYDLLSHDNRVYVLSRDTNGDSVLFELDGGVFKEKYRMKEKLYSCDITDDRLYGIEREECQIVVYELK